MFAGKKRMGAERTEENGWFLFWYFVFESIFIEN